MQSRLHGMAAVAALVLACSPDDAGDTLAPGVCGDGVLDIGEACDVPSDAGCDDACHLTDAIAWTVTRGEPGVFLTYPVDVAVGADGRIVVLGYRWGGGGLPDDGEGWLLALDPSGAVLWEKTVQSPDGGEGIYPSRVAVGPDGSIYHQCFDFFSYTADGEPRWTYAAPTVDGGLGEWRTRSSTALVVAGDAVFTASFGIRELNPDGPSPNDARLHRHDPATGELVWERVLGAEAAVAYPAELAVVGSTLVAAGPASLESFDEGHAFTCADPNTGALSPCVAGAYAFVEALASLPAGDLVFAGGAGEQEFVRRVGLTGDVVWELPLTEDIGTIADLAGGPDGTVVVVGSRGDFDAWSATMRSLDSGGTIVWDREIAPQGEEERSVRASAVAFGPGFVVVAGLTDRSGAITTAWVRRLGPAS